MVHEHHAVHHALDVGQQCEHHREFDRVTSPRRERRFFKAGDRKRSDWARNDARRARAALTEEQVAQSVGKPMKCFCVCEWTRIFTIYASATKRMATALQSWEKRRDHELSFEKGDQIRVIEKAEEEMVDGFSADQPYTWWRGELGGEVGIFPTTQLLYKPSGKPVLDDDHVHTFRNLVVLDATPLYIRYSTGQVVLVLWLRSQRLRAHSMHGLQKLCA
jgi:hypothetical protein